MSTRSAPPLASTPAPGSLSGWRLWLSWIGIASLLLWGIGTHVRDAPIFYELVSHAEPVFLSLQVDSEWTPGPFVTPVTGGVADAAGMPGGYLVGVNGQTVGERDTIVEAARHVARTPGEIVNLTVETEEGDLVSVSVTPTREELPGLVKAGFSWRTLVTVEFIAHLSIYLGFFCAALVLLVRMPRSGIALLAAAAFLAVSFDTLIAQDTATLRGEEGILMTVLRDALFVAFLALFPDGKVRPVWAWVLLAAAGVTSVLELTGVLVSGWEFVVLVGLGLVSQVVRYLQHSSEAERMQTRWVVAGAIAAAVMPMVFAAESVLDYPENSAWYWWASMAIVIVMPVILTLPAGVVVSLLRYRLWDAEAAWSRSTTAAALTLVLASLVAAVTTMAQVTLRAGGPAALTIGAALAALLFVPLQRRVGRWANRRFLRDLHELRAQTPPLIAHLAETRDADAISQAILRRVVPAVHATRAAVVVSNGGHSWEISGARGCAASDVLQWSGLSKLMRPPLAAAPRSQSWRAVIWDAPGDALFPLRVALRSEDAGGESSTQGWLLLGPRPDGSGYGRDDLEALAHIAGPVGRALEIVRTREARSASLARMFEQLAEQQQALVEAIGKLEAGGQAAPETA